MNIKKKMIEGVLIVTTIPLIGLSLLSLNNFNNTVKSQIIASQELKNQQLKAQIRLNIEEPLQTIKSLAVSPDVKNLNYPSVKAYLIELSKNKSGISYVVDNASGMQAIRGDNIVMANVADRNFYKNAMKGIDENYQVVLSKNTGKLVLNMGVPIKKNGVIVGVVQCAYSLSAISNYVKSLSTNGSSVYILDNSGKVMAHPDNKLVTARTDYSKVNYVKNALKEKKSGSVITTDLERGKRLVTYSYDEKTGWVLCIDYPYSIVTAVVNKMMVLYLVLTLVAFAIIIAAVSILARKLTNPIKYLQESADKIAKGDLTYTVEKIATKDEMGKLAIAFKKMADNLKTLIANINQSSLNVEKASIKLTSNCEQSLSASNQVALSIQEVSSDSDKSVRSVDKTSISIDDLLNAFDIMDGKITSMVNTVRNTSEYSSKGKESVDKVNIQMDNIQSTVNELSSGITKLKDRIISIGKFVDVISSIAEQTDLLALNAAIESAHAGEHGKGFSVVASEVRKLADESDNAAKEIKSLISVIQLETKNLETSMEKGTKEVNSGKIIVVETTAVFKDISNSIEEILDEINEISGEMSTIDRCSKEVMESVSNIKEISINTSGKAQTVAASIEEQVAVSDEITNYAKKLGKLSKNLQNSIEQFKI